MITEFNHVCINVKNMEKSVNFYREILGAQVNSMALMNGSFGKCVYIQIADGLIELIEPGTHTNETTYGFKHIAFQVDNLDSAYEYLKQLGYEFTVFPKVAGSGRGRLAFFKDTNGVLVEILERDDNMRRPAIYDKTICSLDHVSLIANNLDTAHKFYTDIMELKDLKTFYVASKELDIVYMNYGKDVLELLHNKTPRTDVPLIAHIACRVKSVPDTYKVLSERGVLFDGEAKLAGIGIGMVANFTDPDGVKIELVDRPDLRDL